MKEKITNFFKKFGSGILMILTIIAGIIIYSQLTKESNNIIENKIGTMPAQITLEQVKISYIPETGEIILIDRNKNTVILFLSKETTTAIYSLKSFAMQMDYESKKNPQTPVPSKKQANAVQQQQQTK